MWLGLGELTLGDIMGEFGKGENTIGGD